jgi:hypothetical protein
MIIQDQKRFVSGSATFNHSIFGCIFEPLRSQYFKFFYDKKSKCQQFVEANFKSYVAETNLYWLKEYSE